jgi:phage-related protein
MEGFKIYISSDGYLIIPDLDIRYLISFTESTIPSMPESAETTVKIAGKDGDISLSTTYEPIFFEIVCYTEDNLSQEQKIKE